MNKLEFQRHKQIRHYYTKEVQENDRGKVQVEIKIKTAVRAGHNRPDLLVYNKREIALPEAGRT